MQRQVGRAYHLGVASDRTRDDLGPHDSLPAIVSQGSTDGLDQAIQQERAGGAVDDHAIQVEQAGGGVDGERDRASGILQPAPSRWCWLPV